MTWGRGADRITAPASQSGHRFGNRQRLLINRWGDLRIRAAGNATYTPAANYNGPASFEYTVCDNGIPSACSTGTVNVTVTPVNDAPVASPQSITVTEDTATTVTLSASDIDSAGLTFSIVANPTYGSLGAVSAATCLTAGAGSTCTATVIYTPASNYAGSDSFTFKASDGSLSSNTAAVSISVTSVNDAPVAASQSGQALKNTARVFSLAASDVDSATLTFSIVTNPTHGTLSAISGTVCTASGGGSNCTANVTYTPTTGYTGSDSFTFKVNDGNMNSSPATVSITVKATNVAPTAAGQSVTTNEDTAKTITLSGADTDSPSLTFSISGVPTHGTLGAISGTTCTPSGGGSTCTASVTYTPAANYNGSDSFTFKTSDGIASSGAATVSITVTSVNDPPTNLVVSVTPATLNEGATATLTGTFADVDTGDTHTVTVAWGNGSSNTTLNLAAGVFTFSTTHKYVDDNPTATAQDVNAITVTVKDAASSSVSANASITVKNVAPVITSITGPFLPILLGMPATITANFTDVGTADTHTCSINWNDTPTAITVGTVTESGGAGNCKATRTYAAPGVYPVDVTITDDDTGTMTMRHKYVVVYTIGGSLVAGLGSINSPVGAYPAFPTVAGKGLFALFAKNNTSGPPIGGTDFVLYNGFGDHDCDDDDHTWGGGFWFHSNSYDSLTFTGSKIVYKGHGTINRTGNYSFQVSLINGTPDKFRLKIWNSSNVVVYDNQMGAPDTADPTTALAGGFIIVLNN